MLKLNFLSKLKNRKPKISIIIPVYNTESYLRQCLDSVSNQTLKDIEIICMDDGSKDNSLDILREYERNDKRFKVLIQENQGQGVARNKCLNEASGEYIMFLDSDDWLDLDACRTLYETAKNNELDILMFLIKNYSNETSEYYEDTCYNLDCLKNVPENKVFNYKDIGNKLFSISVSPCQKIYKREILNDVRFAENIFFEDNPFHWDALFSSKRIAYIKEHFYMRRRHETSTTAQHDHKYLDVIQISNMVVDIFKKHDVYEYYFKRLSQHIVKYPKQVYEVLQDDIKEDYFKLMKNNFMDIQKSEDYDRFIKSLDKNSKKFFLNTVTSKSPAELEELQNTD